MDRVALYGRGTGLKVVRGDCPAGVSGAVPYSGGIAGSNLDHVWLA